MSLEFSRFWGVDANVVRSKLAKWAAISKPQIQDTREPMMRPAVVRFVVVLAAQRSEPTTLQFDRFNFSDESLGVVS